MRSSYGLLMAAAMMGVMAGPTGTRLSWEDDLSPDELEQLRQAKEKKRREMLSKRGVNEYTIDGIIVYARNMKNAVRKAENAKRMMKNELL